MYAFVAAVILLLHSFVSLWFQFHLLSIVYTNVTSPVGAVAKYCNERICVCVCPRAYLLNHMHNLYQIFVHVAYRYGLVILRWGDKIPREMGNFGGFLLHWQCIVHSTAFGIHTKADELIKMSLGLMTRVGPRYRVLDGRPSPKGEGAVFEGKRSKPL